MKYQNSTVQPGSSSSNYHVNSIVNGFEDNAFQETLDKNRKTEVSSKSGLSKQLDDVVFWLNSGFIPMTVTTLDLCSSEEIKDCLKKIDYIQEKLNDLESTFKLVLTRSFKNNSPYKLKCSICSKTVEISKTINFWTFLQNHEHFEEEYVKFLQKDITLNLPVCNKNNTPKETQKPPQWLKRYKRKKISTTIQVKELTKTREPVVSKSCQCNLKHQCEIFNGIGNFKFQFHIDYYEQIKRVIYPQKLVQYVLQLDIVKMITIQKRNSNTVTCLLCYCDIPDDGTFHSIGQHIMGGRHLTTAKKKDVVDALKAYHEYWTRQDLEYQAHQTLFAPHTNNMSECTSCYQYVHYEHVLLHIEDETHSNYILKRHMGNRRANLYLIDLQAAVYSLKFSNGIDQVDEIDQNSESNSVETFSKETMQTNEDDVISDSENSSSTNAKNTNSESSSNPENNTPKETQKHPKLPNYPTKEGIDSSKFSEIAKDTIIVKEVTKITESVPSRSCQSSNFENQHKTLNGIDSFKFQFDLDYFEQIKKVIYPQKLIQKVLKLDPVKMITIQKRNSNTVTCLLCDRDIPDDGTFYSIDQHIMGNRHLTAAKKKDVVDALEAYHNYWTRQDLEYQAHQTLFAPHTNNMSECTSCYQYVHYEHVLLHIEDETHSNYILKRHMGRKRDNIYLIDLQVAVYNIKLLNGNDRVDEIVQNLENNSVKTRSEERIQGNKDDITSDSESSSSTNAKNTNSESSNNPETSPSTSNNSAVKAKHLIVKSVLKSDSKDIADLLENRFLPHLKVIKQEGMVITCTSCKIKFPFQMALLHEHLLDLNHKKITGIPILRYKYCCDICSFTVRTQEQWMGHLRQNKHLSRKKTIETATKSALTEYECKTCRVVIFGDKVSTQKHLKLKVFNRSEIEVTLNGKTKTLLQSDMHITKENENNIKGAREVLSYHCDVQSCCSRIEVVLSNALGTQCRAYPFGSRISGLTSDKNSDLDVFVDLGDMYHGEHSQDAKSQEKFVKKCAKIFRKHSYEFTDINSIPTARTPIIQVFHENTYIDCDLSFKNGLSVENTKFLRFCTRTQPASQCLILYLKEWMKAIKMNERITTYAVAMLAIFFLQSHGFLHSVVRLKQMADSHICIDGWEAIDFSRKAFESVPICDWTMKNLLVGFFQFYTNFDFDKLVVCPLLGKPIPKACFIDNSGGLLPMEMQNYVDKIVVSEEPEIFRAMSALCIQDPFDLSHNLTKACSKETATRLIKLMSLSLNHLQSTP